MGRMLVVIRSASPRTSIHLDMLGVGPEPRLCSSGAAAPRARIVFFLRVRFCVGCASHFPVYTTAAVLCVLVPVGDNVEHARSWSFVLLRMKGRLRRLFLSFSEKVRVRCAIPGLSATYASGVFVCCTNLHSNTRLCWCGWLRWPEMLYALVQPN